MGFFDGGAKTAKFTQVNDLVQGFIVGQFNAETGTIVAYLESQQTNYNTKEPEFYKDGNPVMQAVVNIQTEDRADADDDGLRTVYINKPRLRRAIQKALKDAQAANPSAGIRDLAVGGYIQIWMTGTEVSSASPNPAKTFGATYRPPVGGLAVEESAPPAAPVAAPPVAAPPAAAPVAPPAAAPVAPPAAAPVAPAPAPIAAPPAPAPIAAPPAPAPIAAPPAPAPIAAAPVAPIAAAPIAAAPVAPAAPATPAEYAAPAGSDIPF